MTNYRFGHFIYSLFFGFLLLVFSCSTTPPQNSPTDIPEDFLGIVHAGDTKSSKEYALLDELNVKWVLNTFYWADIERVKDRFDFSAYDDYVDTAKRDGKKIIAVLAYDTPWLFPDGKRKKYISSGNIPYFLRFVEVMVNHYKGRVDVWEIWNEPNFMFWAGSDKEFFELSRQAALKIRETDSDAYILGGAFWRSPAGFIKNMYKAGAMENLDGLAFHPYAVNPSGSMELYDDFSGVLSEINFKGSVWITEIGYPTGGWYPTKVSPEEYPSYVVKTITGAAVRGARVLLWYQLFDAYNEGEAPDKHNSENYFGLVYPDYSRKKGAFAYELCARLLPGSRYVPELPNRVNVPGAIVSFCFFNSKSGNNTLILWNDKNKIEKVELSLTEQAFIYDISSGQRNVLQAGTVLAIGKQPLFIVWQGTGIPCLTGGL